MNTSSGDKNMEEGAFLEKWKKNASCDFNMVVFCLFVFVYI